jgi:lipoprotein-anchoring transpeptidase ErfK/SrfK
MRRLAVALSLAVAVLFSSPSAHAGVLVHIDKSHQRMTVVVDGAPRYSWPVSTGRRGYGTPSGTFRPQFLARRWYSRKYYNSPMPHSIFFHRGFAIHGSYEIRRLGGPASHGCVRLHPVHAAILFALVRKHGTGKTRIVVGGHIRLAEAGRTSVARNLHLAPDVLRMSLLIAE